MMGVGLSDGTNYPDEGSWMASTMPGGSPQEPAGALKSSGGTQTPGNGEKAENLPNIEDVPHHDWVENMFSAAGASFFFSFLPMTPVQILLTNTLYDISQLTLPSDNVDPESLVSCTLCVLPRTTTYIEPEMPYSLL